MKRLHFYCLLIWLIPIFVAAGEDADPPEIAIGERLFLETRFAQFFATNGRGGDSAMDITETIGAPLPGPFAGESMNCAACHLVDQQLQTPNGGMRTYADFARRSPLQPREDGRTHAVRNSPPLVNASLTRAGGPLFHFDGEFRTLEDLVRATFTGRMLGWLPGEAAQAAAHIAEIIRRDDGQGALAQAFGGAYSLVLTGTDPSLPAEFRLPPEFRVEVATASDAQILDAVVKLTARYVESLEFARDEDGAFTLSPYDRFLALNSLPRQPRPSESDARYSRRLLRAVNRLTSPKFVTRADGSFRFHDQDFAFGPTELRGMRIFFTRAEDLDARRRRIRGGVGNCIACHTAPAFTDFQFHNTGITQEEYDDLHGDGAFLRLYIPGLKKRNANPNRYLPASARHPHAQEPFRAIPSVGAPGLTDLGLWNIFANPDVAGPQRALREMLCNKQSDAFRLNRHCADPVLLRAAIARFKTPGLRDLGHSAPYMHNGQLNRLADVVEFYRRIARAARRDRIRNGAAELTDIRLQADDVAPLTAFLRALNEDYE